MSTSPEVTDWLQAWRKGEAQAAEGLMAEVYSELRRTAQGFLAKERADHTLQPTALVHEAFMRLNRQQHLRWQDRGHFFALAATMMRRVLVDHARRCRADKRGADLTVITLSLDGGPAAPESTPQGIEVLALHDALTTLARIDPFKSSLVELRFFGGLTVSETAEALDCSVDKITRHWRSSRAWLARELAGISNAP